MSNRATLHRDLERCGGIADLSGRTKLMIRGADRVRYLNGQVTSNVARLATGQTQPACVTTAKGKLCAEVMITSLDDALLVDAEASLVDSLPERLERYIVADDVTVEQAPADVSLLHVIGRDPSMIPGLADVRFQRARRFGVWGWDWWSNPSTTSQSGSELASRFPILDEAFLETMRVERGVPKWGYELDESILPAEAGLDDTHIDFHKGCYIGQEVISRLKSIGHVNRKLAGFVAGTSEPLTPGSAVFPAGDLERQIGQLTSAVWSFALEKYVALGYLKRGAPVCDLVSRPRGRHSLDTPVTAQALPFVS